MHLIEHLEIYLGVVILQDQLEGVWFHLSLTEVLTELIQNGVVKVNHVQFVRVFILNANEKVIRLRDVSLANRDRLVFVSNLNSSNLGVLVCINQKNEIA
jgi:hypothetical protein